LQPFNGGVFRSFHDLVREMLVRFHLGLIVANPDGILKLPIELDRAKMLEVTPTREVEAPQWVQRWPQL
jgi:hypothetical protein